MGRQADRKTEVTEGIPANERERGRERERGEEKERESERKRERGRV